MDSVPTSTTLPTSLTATASTETTFTVIDSIMGSGKTQFMIARLNQWHLEDQGMAFSDNEVSTDSRRFLYVTPTLTEVDRITAACPNLQFRNPQPIEGRKLNHLSTLIEGGANICTTHSLFSLLTPDICRRIAAQRYTLVIDEVLSTVEVFDRLSLSDHKALLANSYVRVDPSTRKLVWNHQSYPNYSGRFDDIRALCDNGNLVRYRDKVLLWEFPVDFLMAFTEVFIVTYLFEGSTMANLLKAARIPYVSMGLHEGRLVPRDAVDERAIRKEIRSLLDIYKGPANRLGDGTGKENPLSSTWFKRMAKQESVLLRKLQFATENFFRYHSKTPTARNAWTTFKPMSGKLKGPGYTKGFIPINMKATNDYIEKSALAHLGNIFYHPYLKAYFEEQGVAVNEDAYALSELIQWIWRSQIRRGDTVKLFLPSSRMRGLLEQWLDGAIPGRIEALGTST